MDFALDDEQGMIVQTVRRFVERDVRTWAAEADRDATPPARLLAVASDLGFLTDGLETPYAHLTRALRGLELGRGCAAIAALLECNVEPALAVGRWGDDAAKASLRTSLERGGLATTARDARGRLSVEGTGDAVRVTGPIGPTPALAIASHLLLLAGPLTLLLDVEHATAVTLNVWRCARWGSLACKDTTARVLSRDPAVQAEILAWYRASLAARATGVAIASMEYAAKYAEERVQFGQPIGRFEALIRLRDDAETGAAAARLLALHAAWLIDRGDPAAADTASRARVLAGDVVARATIDAVQIYGGYGFVNDFPVEKLMRDARPFEALGGDERFERVLAERARKVS